MSRDHTDLTHNRAVPSAPVSFASQADADERRFEQPDAELVAYIRRHLPNACPNCNPTAKAIARVQAQWVVAGIDKD